MEIKEEKTMPSYNNTSQNKCRKENSYNRIISPNENY